MVVVGCIFIMTYNCLPTICLYLSFSLSLGNTFIKQTISRNRFEQFFSQLYAANLKKPPNAGKTYYIDEMIQCLKATFFLAEKKAHTNILMI